MEKVRPLCGQPSDRGRLKNRKKEQTDKQIYRRGNCDQTNSYIWARSRSFYIVGHHVSRHHYTDVTPAIYRPILFCRATLSRDQVAHACDKVAR